MKSLGIAPEQDQVPKPQVQDVIDYIAALYHGLPVQELQFPRWGFTPWADDKTKLGLNTQKQCIQIVLVPHQITTTPTS
ncbi:hypothetical protein BDV06DRAFT_193187 [Aspergillus oleicola]